MEGGGWVARGSVQGRFSPQALKHYGKGMLAVPLKRECRLKKGDGEKEKKNKLHFYLIVGKYL